MSAETTNTTEMELEQTGNPTPAAPTADKPASDKADSTPKADTPTGKTYTDEELAALKNQWQQEYETAKTAEKDFAKMTPEQQVQKLLDDQKRETARLEAELLDRDLTDYARGKVAEAELPSGALEFVKGKDRDTTDANIKAFSKLLADGIQSGVEKRFKDNGYTPKVSAAGHANDGKTKRQRGVTINEKK